MDLLIAIVLIGIVAIIRTMSQLSNASKKAEAEFIDKHGEQ